MTRNRLLLALLAAATMVCALFAILELRRPPAASAVGWRFRFPAGTRLTYALSWQGAQSAHLTDDRLAEGSADVDADLTLRSYGEVDGVWRLGLSLAHFRKHQLSALGQEVMKDVQGFDGHEALVDLEPNGRVRGIHLQPGDPDLFKHVTQWVATQLQVVLADERTWTAGEPGPFGASQVRYRLDGDRRGAHAPRLHPARRAAGQPGAASPPRISRARRAPR